MGLTLGRRRVDDGAPHKLFGAMRLGMRFDNDWTLASAEFTASTNDLERTSDR